MTDQLVKDNERIDDLQNGYYVIQDPDKFCFGMDAVLLSRSEFQVIYRKFLNFFLVINLYNYLYTLTEHIYTVYSSGKSIRSRNCISQARKLFIQLFVCLLIRQRFPVCVEG